MTENTETDAVATPEENTELEHTAGGATTRDGMDAGVPMLPGDPREPIGPEDAMGPGPKRGDYSDRLNSGPHLRTEVIPEDERRKVAEAMVKDAGTKSGLTVAAALGDVPRTRLVPQDQPEQGDEPGKGGVAGSDTNRDVAVPSRDR